MQPQAFWDSYRATFRRYADFNGRASRGEFWAFILVYVVICIAASLLDRIFGMGQGRPGLFLSIAELAQLLPLIAVGVRRLHDIDRTGWWQLLMLSGIGVLLLVFFYAQRGEALPNRFGTPPADAPGLL